MLAAAHQFFQDRDKEVDDDTGRATSLVMSGDVTEAVSFAHRRRSAQC